MIEGQTILILSTADWDSPLWTNKQHIAKRLAERNRVFYVESLGMRAPRFSWDDLKRVFKRLGSSFGRRPKNPVPKDLTVLSPAVIPFWGSSWVRRMNVTRLCAWLNERLAQEGVTRYILWCYTPYASLLLDRLEPAADKVVYHCVDNLSAFPGIPQALTRGSEDALFNEADVVFFTSRQMCDDHAAQCRKAVFVGNVADTPAAEPSLEDASPLAALPRPLLGFAGAIDSAKLDWSILEELAGPAFPGALILVGPLAATESPERLEALRKSKKVVWLDGKSQAEALAWMSRCDVLIIPYRINEYTRYVFPMKLFEYLSLGKPVVSTPLPEVLPFIAHVSIAATPETFSQAALDSFKADSSAAQAARRELAKRHTWTGLLETMSQSLGGVRERVPDA